MDLFTAFLLGIIQGVTEFLPVSSSGHLELTKAFLGNSKPEEGLLFTLVVHAATALSTVFVFRNDIYKLLVGLFRWEKNESWLFVTHIVISMFPAAIVGLFFEDPIANLFEGNLFLVGLALLVTGILLRLADTSFSTQRSLGSKHALLIGLAQAIAILPGISRSGATIATAVLLGVEREKAARFSFLMVIPLIFGSLLKKIMDAQSSVFSGELLPLSVGFLSALLTGILACRWMIALVKRSQLKFFAYYCFAVGTLALFYVYAL
ncbi:MAG: undecaprenyl-diphosphate phosphatase [Flavobacteriaceae bacterium]